MNYLWRDGGGGGRPFVINTRERVLNGQSIGACCGSDFFNKSSKTKKKHRGIVVMPQGVSIDFSCKQDKLTTTEVVTKNGTFTVSIRGEV